VSSPPNPAEDREAIRALLTLYGRLWDQGAVREVVALFTANGEWRSKLGSATGPVEIEALLARIGRGRGNGEAPARRHFVANFTIDLAGDVAMAESDFLVVQQDGGAFTIVSMGSYRDRLARQQEGWRILQRVIVHPG
jgi:hypothetical protein